MTATGRDSRRALAQVMHTLYQGSWQHLYDFPLSMGG
uniref:Endod1 protein n=1 Tax=Mus musculus TaxID=10090 RepID=Q8K3B8_MOUSE|nr:Endod1 protein [Mus musculus]